MKERYVYIKNASSEEYRQKLELMDQLGIDPFTEEYLEDLRFGKKIIISKTEHWTVFTNEHTYANTKYQFVFTSKEYVENIWELSDEAFLSLKQLLGDICHTYNITGGGIVTRFGEPVKSGATVRHLHLQLIEPDDNKNVAAWFGEKQ